MPLCTKWGPWRHGALRLEWKNENGLHRALTSIPRSTFRNSTALQASSHNIMHKCTNHRDASKSSGKPSQNSGDYYTCKGGFSLEWDSQKPHVNVMFRCTQTFKKIHWLINHHSVQLKYARNFKITLFWKNYIWIVHCRHATHSQQTSYWLLICHEPANKLVAHCQQFMAVDVR